MMTIITSKLSRLEPRAADFRDGKESKFYFVLLKKDDK